MDCETENCEVLRLAANDPNWLQYVLRAHRLKGTAEHRFDLNLIEGEIKEEALRQLFAGTRVEVKRDFAVSRSQNVAVELSEDNRPTGLNSTESEWWVIVLDGSQYDGEIVLCIRTERMKRITAANTVVKLGGDKGRTLLSLVPKADLLKTNDQLAFPFVAIREEEDKAA